jgi:hypothetical protein
MKNLFLFLALPFFAGSCSQVDTAAAQSTGQYGDYYEMFVRIKLVDVQGHNLLERDSTFSLTEKDIEVTNKTADYYSKNDLPVFGVKDYLIQGDGSNTQLCLFLNGPNENKESSTHVRIDKREYVFKALYNQIKPTGNGQSYGGAGGVVSARKVYCDDKLILDRDLPMDTIPIVLIER